MQIDRPLQILIFHDVKDRGEGFRLHSLGLTGHVDKRRGNIRTARHACSHRITSVNDTALGPRLVERRLHGIARCVVDQWSDQRSFRARVANRQAAICFGQLGHEIVLDRFVNDQPAQRGAALSGRANGRKDNCADRHFQIRRRCDDHGIVSAELQNRPAPAGGNLWTDDATHTGGTRR